jgi:hypothetical protein
VRIEGKPLKPVLGKIIIAQKKAIITSFNMMLMVKLGRTTFLIGLKGAPMEL